MKPIQNTIPNIQPGQRIKLLHGETVVLPLGKMSYAWESFETVEKIEGNIIFFSDCPNVDWYTTDMGWEIK